MAPEPNSGAPHRVSGRQTARRGVRAIGSMRARMTLVCVLALAPFLVLCCKLLPIATLRAEDASDHHAAGQLARDASRYVVDAVIHDKSVAAVDMRGLSGSPDASLVSREPLMRRADVPPGIDRARAESAILILRPDNSVYWRSAPGAPEWPPRYPAHDADWRFAATRVGGDGYTVVVATRYADGRGLPEPPDKLLAPAIKTLDSMPPGIPGLARKTVALRIRGLFAEQLGVGLPDVEKRLTAFVNSSPLAAKLGAAMLLVDPPGRTVWASRPGAPAWSESGPADPRWLTSVAKVPPGYILVAAVPRTAGARAAVVQMWELAALSLAVLLAAAGGAWLVVGRTLSPIHRLAQQAAGASVENLAVQLEPPSRDLEIVQLVGTLNGLLGRLAETAAAKGRFYAAASHELRTPLQALTGHLEVALSRRRSAEEYEAALEEAHRQTGRLSSLVGDLLLLHRLESPATLAACREAVDLTCIVQQVTASVAPLAEARGVVLQEDLTTPRATVVAPPTHAEIVVRNIVDNAVRYSPPGGLVDVKLDAEYRGGERMPGGSVVLEVRNPCPAELPLDVGHLSEPFFRPDAARVRGRHAGGNGLGLAICRAVSDANGWSLTVRREGEAFVAVVDFR